VIPKRDRGSRHGALPAHIALVAKHMDVIVAAAAAGIVAGNTPGAST
jgi:hypothetical protein